MNLTPAAERAIEAARRWAVRQRYTDVQPTHLLAGLLEEEEGRAAVLLARAGLQHLYVDVRTPATDDGSLTPEGRALPLSQELGQVLDDARNLAGLASRDHTVGSDHLLLALLQADDALRRSLEERGLNYDALQTMVLGTQEKSIALDAPLELPDATDEIDLARILDVGANRAREALRVIEDYCRFVLDDAFLCRRWKQLRHDLSETLADLSAESTLEARDTIRDVGTAISTDREQHRTSLQSVIQANCKRLQEALRSLEEYGKLRSPLIGQTFERLRYQSYTLERAIILGTQAHDRLADACLCVLLTSERCQAALDWTIQEAAAGGAQIFQLREKNLSDRELVHKARQVRRWTRAAGVLFILNDRPDIARLSEADGVHLGQDDMPVKDARRILGPSALIGVSTHNLDQVRQAVLDGASYIGVGPTFPSDTKEFSEFPGLDFALAAAAETSLPAFVIGGVNVETVAQVAAAGLKRVAVSDAICQAEDPRRAARELRRALGLAVGTTKTAPASPRGSESRG